MPELMWFLFKTATEHLEANESSWTPGMRIAEKGDFLEKIVRPIYNLHSEALYTKNEKHRFVKREEDHAQTVG
jgi:hypothetical protein